MNFSKSLDFASFVSANSGRVVSSFDYLHVVYKAQALPSDFIFMFAKLFRPEFTIIDGMAFISELFDADRYRALLISGQSTAQAQFWMNLLEITGLFDDLPTEQAMVIAQYVVDSWNSRLRDEVGGEAHARAIFDEGTQEVFVTIGVPD